MCGAMDEDIYACCQATLQIIFLSKSIIMLLYCFKFQMRFFEKLSFNEIGAVLGLKPVTAKIRVYRALEKLKKQIQSRLLCRP